MAAVAPYPQNLTPDLLVHADGGTWPDHERRAYYYSVAIDEEVVARHECEPRLPVGGSAGAELHAMAGALREVRKRSEWGQKVLLRSDNQAVVSHITQRKPPRSERLLGVYGEVVGHITELSREGVHVIVQWVPRKEMVAILGH